MLTLSRCNSHYFVEFRGCIMYAAYSLFEAQQWITEHIQDYQ